MTPIDFTSELAPLIWTMEGLMLVAVAWLVGMFFTEQMRSHDFLHSDRKSVSSHPEPTTPAPRGESTSDDDRRMAA